jgi:type II secretory pathway pseudopilin PulG
MGLVDVMITLLLVMMAGLIFTATFPSGFNAVRQARETKKAVAIAQRKLEQVQALGYENLSYDNLRRDYVIDAEPSESSYSFTSMDDLDSSLASPEGKLSITEDTSGVKTAVVTIEWNNRGRKIELRTLVADKRMWRRS